jgi:endonuclease YncB( thermonuclease family)
MIAAIGVTAMSVPGEAHAKPMGFFKKSAIVAGAAITAGVAAGTAAHAAMKQGDPNTPFKTSGNAFGNASGNGTFAYEIRGRVVAVSDGDTMTILDANHVQNTIRLADIDAPESNHGNGRPGQPFSSTAKQALSSMVFGKNVIARCHERDKYDRNVCRIFVPSNGGDVGTEIDANMQMVRSGLAWANTADPRYLRDKTMLARQDEARAKQVGVWSSKDPVPPWQWRHTCWDGKTGPVCAAIE